MLILWGGWPAQFGFFADFREQGIRGE